MVKLVNPLNHKGVIFEAGSILNLGEEMEQKLIKNKNAEQHVSKPPKEPPKEPGKGQGKEGEE